MKKKYLVTAICDKDEKVFPVYSSRNYINRISEKMARNLFYSDDARVIEITQVDSI